MWYGPRALRKIFGEHYGRKDLNYFIFREERSGAMLKIARVDHSSHTMLKAMVEHADDLEEELGFDVQCVVGGQHDWDNALAFDLCPRYDYEGAFVPVD